MPPTPTPPAPLAACLPATGFDATPLIFVFALAVILLVAGLVAVRTSKARVAVVLAPLALLSIVFGAVSSSAPAQAAPPVTKIADFTVSNTWTPIPVTVYESAPATQEHQDALTQLEEWAIEFDTQVTQTLTLTASDGSQTVELSPAAISSFGLEKMSVLQSAVATAQNTFVGPGRYGNLTLTYTVTWPYFDQCAKPLSTVTTWTGTVNFIEPPA